MRYTASIGVAAALSFILFFVALFGSDLFEPWKNALTDWHCKSGEVLTARERYTYTETQLEYFCEDDAGHTREVTGGVLASSCGVSLLFFLGLSLLFVLFSFTFVRKKPVDSVDSVVLLLDHTAFDSPQALRRMENANVAGDKAGMSLAARLQQLQEALDQGLISQDEYEQTRKAILNRMDD